MPVEGTRAPSAAANEVSEKAADPGEQTAKKQTPKKAQKTAQKTAHKTARRISAGLLLHRSGPHEIEVLLVHPGGPFWAKRDLGAWSIPKGEIGQGEDPLTAAIREVSEEIGLEIPRHEGSASPIVLAPVRQAGGKTVFAWALAAELDPTVVRSNTFRLEWPPKSGEFREFPEVDRAAWFPLTVAAEKILAGQVPLLAELRDRILRPAGLPR